MGGIPSWTSLDEALCGGLLVRNITRPLRQRGTSRKTGCRSTRSARREHLNVVGAELVGFVDDRFSGDGVDERGSGRSCVLPTPSRAVLSTRVNDLENRAVCRLVYQREPIESMAAEFLRYGRCS